MTIRRIGSGATLGMLLLLPCGCGQPYRAERTPALQEFPQMTRRIFRDADPAFALHAAGWTLADLGFAVMAVDLGDGAIHAKKPELFDCGATVRATRLDDGAVLVELTIDWPYGSRIADPDFYESFFVPLGRTMRRTPEPS